MPTYVYEVVEPDGSGGERFEVVQRMRDDPLETHPETGAPVRRVLMAPNIGGSPKSALSDANLSRLGFTKYQNAGGGKFERRAGSGGPESVQV